MHAEYEEIGSLEQTGELSVTVGFIAQQSFKMYFKLFHVLRTDQSGEPGARTRGRCVAKSVVRGGNRSHIS